jgi:hypothetical protein
MLAAGSALAIRRTQVALPIDEPAISGRSLARGLLLPWTTTSSCDAGPGAIATRDCASRRGIAGAIAFASSRQRRRASSTDRARTSCLCTHATAPADCDFRWSSSSTAAEDCRIVAERASSYQRRVSQASSNRQTGRPTCCQCRQSGTVRARSTRSNAHRSLRSSDHRIAERAHAARDATGRPAAALPYPSSACRRIARLTVPGLLGRHPVGASARQPSRGRPRPVP